MASTLDVRTSFAMRLGCGAALMLGFAAPCFVSGIFGVVNGEATSAQLGMTFGIGSLNLIVFGLVPVLIFTRRQQSVARLDATGVTRFDGTVLPWSGFQGVQRTLQRNRYGHTSLQRAELKFTEGSALIFVSYVSNAAEVLAAVDALEAGNNPFR